MGIHNLSAEIANEDLAGEVDQVFLKDNASVLLGTGKDVDVQWDGTNLTLVPVADNTGQIIVGNGTLDMDLKIFMGSTSSVVLFDNSAGQVELDNTKLGEHWMKAPVAKTGDYTVVESDSGTHFTTEGAGSSVEFTLPDVTLTGFHAWFHQAEDQSMKVTSADANLMIASEDVAATSVDFTTATEHVGNCFYVISDGVKWQTINSAAAPHQAVNGTVA